ncbi:uncharacterized protein [Fopius arisanus]|uniref:Tetratricopeptide repeat protein 29 n=1 Tax=Fopius arisanus TaxID=64838 RepID=A0A9R1U2G3_9HYME|nr:PREDICTED: uncharacterized protein LOC105267513 [Fopius arisanus]
MSKKRNPMRKSCDENGRFVVKSNIMSAPRIKTLTRARKEEISPVKAHLKAQLPALTSTGVRRYRLPYHESILLELNEAGFFEAKDYLKRLYEHDNELEIPKIKKLKEQRHLIEKIQYGLVNAELAKRRNEKIEQAMQMLKIALFFQSLMPEWFWIADEFFKSALKISSEIVEDGGEILNIIKYIYGNFLFHGMRDPMSAFTLLDEARKGSQGKPWDAYKILKNQPRYLFRDINLVLNEVLIALAQQSRKTHRKFAVEIVTRAIERAIDSGSQEHLARSLYEAGVTYMSAGNIDEALDKFLEYLARVERISDPNGLCEAHKQLAAVYQVLEDSARVKWHLILFKQHAEQSGLVARLAEAHYYLGKFELEEGRPSSATPHLTFAFESYKNLEMINEMDKARFLAGMSKGL